jgi:hypothetical protein
MTRPTRPTRLRRAAHLAVVATALALPACDRVQGARRTYADLSAVRRAVQPVVGSSAVEARIADGTTLAVAIVNHPIQLRPAGEKRAKAREVATAAFAAYPERAGLGGVRVDFVARGGFALLTVSVSEPHSFEPSALRAAPPAPTPAS